MAKVITNSQTRAADRVILLTIHKKKQLSNIPYVGNPEIDYWIHYLPFLSMGWDRWGIRSLPNPSELSKKIPFLFHV